MRYFSLPKMTSFNLPKITQFNLPKIEVLQFPENEIFQSPENSKFKSSDTAKVQITYFSRNIISRKQNISIPRKWDVSLKSLANSPKNTFATNGTSYFLHNRFLHLSLFPSNVLILVPHRYLVLRIIFCIFIPYWLILN